MVRAKKVKCWGLLCHIWSMHHFLHKWSAEWLKNMSCCWLQDHALTNVFMMSVDQHCISTSVLCTCHPTLSVNKAYVVSYGLRVPNSWKCTTPTNYNHESSNCLVHLALDVACEKVHICIEALEAKGLCSEHLPHWWNYCWLYPIGMRKTNQSFSTV